MFKARNAMTGNYIKYESSVGNNYNICIFSRISPPTMGLSIQFQTYHLSGRDKKVAVVVMVETNFSVKL